MTKKSTHTGEVKNLKFWSNFYAFILLIGILGMVSVVYIYRKTFIDIIILFPIIIIPTLCAYLIMQKFKHYRQVQVNSKLFIPLIMWAPSVGFITCFLFMSLNYYLADEGSAKNEVIRIKEMTFTKGYKVTPQPIVTIDYQRTEHELTFPSNYVDAAKRADSVQLQIKPGFFGFDVIQKQTLLLKDS